MNSFSKVIFFVSLFTLGVFYGILSNKLKIFPQPQLRKAWNQAEVAFGLTGFEDQSRVYDRDGVRLLKPGAIQSGVTLVSIIRQQGGGTSSLEVISKEGEVLHDWEVDPRGIFNNVEENVGKSKISGATLLESGGIIFNLNYTGTVKLNSCGDVMWKVNEKGHHSVEQSGEDGVWIPSVSHEKVSIDYPGFKEAWSEKILHLTGDGKVSKEISLLDIIYENNLERHLVKTRVNSFDKIEKVVDITHLNDVEPLSQSMASEYSLFEAGDLVVSLRAANLVFVFNPNSGNVKWHASLPFIAQHDPDFIGGGWIGVFDNRTDGTKRGSMLGGSRIVAVKPGSDSTRVLFPTSESDPFYTEVQGKWQHLPKGNMLLSEARKGRVIEVDSEGQTVWEFVESNVSAMHAWHYDNITRNQVASWPCSSVDSAMTSTQNQ